MSGYRTFGTLWCPMCFCRREFIAEDESAKDVNQAECEECGYSFGHATDELHVEGSGTSQRYVTQITPVISQEKADAARKKRLQEHTTSMASSGVRMEVLRHGTRRTEDR